ncbi:MAG: AtpZ/AtpI family protein [Candidatus Competibacteraceae bacterium]|nr:AtpZ/AtpI family protein [Candidatus Competibacteraceae bacterium]HRY16698.1 AtpZ/AtpI family protein [Candidatus Competibacteraceae bacterium]
MTEPDPLLNQVGRKATRKQRARETDRPSVWFGLGLFGAVGWSVALPTVLGALLGLWLDRNWPGPHSWTLTLLAAGLVLGCANAWRWLHKQYPPNQEQRND